MNHRSAKIVKLGAAALVAVALMQPAMAGEGRALPGFALVDSAGLAVDSAELRQSGRWILVVLDAGMASSQNLMNVLARREEGYGERMVVVASGAQAQSFIAANQKLAGIRWLVDPERASSAALRLSVTPVLLALDESNRIAWQVAGQPKRGSVGPMVAQWLKLAPVQSK